MPSYASVSMNREEINCVTSSVVRVRSLSRLPTGMRSCTATAVSLGRSLSNRLHGSACREENSAANEIAAGLLAGARLTPSLPGCRNGGSPLMMVEQNKCTNVVAQFFLSWTATKTESRSLPRRKRFLCGKDRRYIVGARTGRNPADLRREWR